MTAEEERIIHKRYGEIVFTHDENNAIYDCYMQGVNRDGHVWVTWTDVERLLCDFDEVRWTPVKMENQNYIKELSGCKRHNILVCMESATGRKNYKTVSVYNGYVESKENRIVAYCEIKPYWESV